MKNILIILAAVLLPVVTLQAFELTLGKEYSLEEGQQGSAIIFHEGFFYIADWINTKLYVYDSEFTLVKQLLERGQGPGEITGKVFYPAVSPDGVLYLFDPMVSRFHTYQNLEYEDSWNLNTMLNRFVFAHENSAIFSYIMNPENKVLVKMNVKTGKVENEYSLKTKERGKNAIIEGQLSMLKIRNDLFLGYLLKNELLKYSLNNDRLLKETELPDIKTTKSSDNPIVATYIIAIKAYRYHILILASDYKGKKIGEIKPDMYFYLYDKDLEYVERIKVEESLVDFCINGSTVYGLGGDTVFEYKITF